MPSTVAPGVLEQLQRLGVVADLDPDVGQDSVGVLLDQRKALFAEQLVRRDLAADERRRVRSGAFTRSCRHPRRSPTAGAMTGLVHPNPLLAVRPYQQVLDAAYFWYDCSAIVH